MAAQTDEHPGQPDQADLAERDRAQGGDDGQGQADRRPGHGDPDLGPRALRDVGELGHAPDRHQQDLPDPAAVAHGHHRVPEFVQRDAGEEPRHGSRANSRLSPIPEAT